MTLLQQLDLIDDRALTPESDHSARLLECVIESVRFHDPVSEFFVASTANEETVKGVADFVPVGVALTLTGKWIEDGRYGWQFSVERMLFETDYAIMLALLASGFLDGIAATKAAAMVQVLGLETFDVLDAALERSPEAYLRLIEVPGIKAVTAERVLASWRGEREWARAALLCLRAGLTLKEARHVREEFPHDLVEVIEQHPYRLTRVTGITWATADAVAKKAWPGKAPIDHDAPQRYAAALREILQRATVEGHLYLPVKEARGKAIMLAQPSAPVSFWPAVERVLSDEGMYLIDGDALYLERWWEIERQTASALASLQYAESTRVMPRWEDVDPFVNLHAGFALSEDQQEALRLAFSAKVVALTGGPGTGKTSMIRAIIGVCEQYGFEYLLAAPTGRAADRMAKATGRTAGTLHKVFGITPGVEGTHNYGGADFVIIDEMSMVDAALFHAVLQALDEGEHLIMVGDVDQLPPVGPGAPFDAVIRSGQVPTARLTTIHRQGEQSGIVHLAHSLNNGTVCDVSGFRDVYIGTLSSHARKGAVNLRVAAVVPDMVQKIMDKYGLALSEIMVLTPVNQYPWGQIALNKALQERFNPQVAGFVAPDGVDVRVGDPVIHLKNNYTPNMAVMNGQTGVVRIVVAKDQEVESKQARSASQRLGEDDVSLPLVWVDYDGRLVGYTREYLDQLGMAYALTVHKAQGGEKRAVVFVVPEREELYLQRQLAYTAITRAAEYLLIVEAQGALLAHASNSARIRRLTRLDTLLSRPRQELYDDEIPWQT